MIVVVMGVAGCGKTSVGRALAGALDAVFLDADDHHTASNRAKLAADIPLGDEDRRPWLEELAGLLAREADAGHSVVLACSALRQAYRDLLATCGHPLVFVHLVIDRAEARRRLAARAGSHALVGAAFDRVLDGQFRDLEPPVGAITVACAESPVATAARVLPLLPR